MAPRCYALVASCSRCRLAAPAHRQLSAAVPAAIVPVQAHDAGAAPGPSSQRRPYTSSSSLPLSASQRPASPLRPIDGQQRRRFSATALTSAKKKGKSKASSSSAAADDQAAAPSRYPPLPPGWQAVIGVECHVQIKDTHKLFSSAPLPTPSSPLNSLVTPFDAAHPGTFPTLNRSALRLAARTALALNCKVHGESRFDRKHYFYSDLPAGYQITQKYAPLANNGSVRLSFHDGHLPSPEDEVTVEIEQLQLEQDTAKSSYFDTGTTSRLDASRQSPADEVPEATLHEADDERVQRSFVDLNRAGAGLMEIVSGPQMRTPEQAGAYVRKLQELVRRVGASDGNMQEGSLRCDVNVSVNRVGEPFGTRCEVKNLNSVRFMMNAISHEAHRQVQLLEQPGGCVEQETRGYNESNGTTFRLRGKEDAPDYRYMPDPNLPPVLLSEMQIQELRDGLPELPDAKRARLSKQYGLASRDINVLMRVGSEDDRDGRIVASVGDAEYGQASSDAVEYFERVAEGRNAQTALNWIIHELMKGLNARNLPFREWYLPANYLGQLIDLVEAGQVTGTTAKAVIADVLSSASTSSTSDISLAELDRLAQTSSTPVFDLLQKQELLALATTQDLLPLVESAFQRLPDEVAQVRKGNLKVAMRIVGQVMKDANGRADAKLVHSTILQQLAQPPSSS